jgi:hypothetical protein
MPDFSLFPKCELHRITRREKISQTWSITCANTCNQSFRNVANAQENALGDQIKFRDKF